MSKDKWLIVGANGALGSDLIEAFGEAAIPATRLDFDMTHKEDMYQFIINQPITGVINTAAFHNVPLCEKEPQNAFEVNALGVKNLAELCAYLNIHLCHISTDYVFDGSKQKPYLETDLPRPLNTYAISKLAGEQMVQAYCPSHTIIRSCGLYGRVPTRAKGDNFITKIVKQAKSGASLKVVNDEWVTPTCTHDLAFAIKALLANWRHEEVHGLFHVNQAGETTWFDVAKVVLDSMGFQNTLEAVSKADFPSTLNRPTYSILSCDRFKHVSGHQIDDWETALRNFLKRHGEELKD